ncbi:MAG: proline--tRNA ligase [Verrucomicrobiae bacterium]|nr:proline--tRNA ligase [Verrucomicrobiae bacterium]MDW7979484.1 proline--tRNA ligase [Verrucomicrobiales bacterium]
MRWTQTFIPTLKETPAEAEITSHKLLLRAGLARRLAGGLYTFLPLGLRVLRKIEAIIREEMNRAGALEVAMPCLQPPEIWQKSGRYQDMSEVLYHVYDRAKKEWLLGPTHEENITVLVASEINSYRQLPKNFYQITVKFRDEIRPRFGLMRAREFVMKDAYSFDVDERSAEVSYQKMYDAYVRIFERCGLRTIAVEAHTGAIGGSFSHEFMVPAESGENEIAFCESGKYAANVEKAVSQGPLIPTPTASTGASPEKFPTPGVLTIEALAQPPYNVPAHHQIKTLVYIVESKPVVLLLRGDDQLNEAKLAGALGTVLLRPATPEEIYELLGAHPGSLGAVGVTHVPVYADLALRGAAGMTTGANQDGFHLRHVDIARDIKVTRWLDLRTVKAGELCLATGLPLKISRAIEVGHIFKLGTKYSEKLGAVFLDEQGRPRPAVMGCYGIGVTRTLQAIIEQSNDKDGIIWPMSVAPYTVCITPLDVTPGGRIMSIAEQIYRQLIESGVDAILDDRDERPGVKFKDSELVGFPIRVAVGEKSLANEQVEIKPRAGQLMLVHKTEAVNRVLELIKRAN